MEFLALVEKAIIVEMLDSGDSRVILSHDGGSSNKKAKINQLKPFSTSIST